MDVRKNEMTDTKYPSVLDASRGLLLDAVRVARKADTEFCVVGGWSPYIRNAAPIPHPGTKDVDLLFKKGAKSGELSGVIHAFLDAGYLVSAKHQFQLLRRLNVNGKPLIFNVDFLHPLETTQAAELMVDHMDLDVLECREREEGLRMKSIALPASDFVFDGHVVNAVVSAVDPTTGNEEDVNVPLIDEVGVFITKFQSVMQPKRPRDAFDIFVSLTQSADQEATLAGICALRARYEGIDKLARCFLKFLKKDTFEKNVCRFGREMKHPIQNPRKTVKDLIARTSNKAN